MIFEPTAADLDLADVETALLTAALGDYTAEAAVLLLVNAGHWLPQLQAAGLITVEDAPGSGERWAQIQWGELDAAARAGRITGEDSQLRILCAAGSIADGQPVDLGDLAGNLDRRALILLLAAIAHAGGSHDHYETSNADTAEGIDIYTAQGIGEGAGGGIGIPLPGQPLPPLVPWPARS